MCTNAAFAEDELSTKIPKAVMEQALTDNDPTILIKDYLLPMLASNDQATLLFAAELGISNGRPYFDFGERSVFGKLVDAGSIMKYKDQYIDLVDDCYQEYRRLLLGVYEENGQVAYGKWEKDGKTIFKFARRSNRRCLSYETGTWVKVREVYGIQIDHWTELSGGHRTAFLECDWQHLINNEYFLATFRIVRK